MEKVVLFPSLKHPAYSLWSTFIPKNYWKTTDSHNTNLHNFWRELQFFNPLLSFHCVLQKLEQNFIVTVLNFLKHYFLVKFIILHLLFPHCQEFLIWINSDFLFYLWRMSLSVKVSFLTAYHAVCWLYYSYKNKLN